MFINTTGNAGLAKGGSGRCADGAAGGADRAVWDEGSAARACARSVSAWAAAELLSHQSDPSGILAGEVAHAIPFARRKLIEELQARG